MKTLEIEVVYGSPVTNELIQRLTDRAMEEVERRIEEENADGHVTDIDRVRQAARAKIGVRCASLKNREVPIGIQIADHYGKDPKIIYLYDREDIKAPVEEPSEERRTPEEVVTKFHLPNLRVIINQYEKNPPSHSWDHAQQVATAALQLKYFHSHELSGDIANIPDEEIIVAAFCHDMFASHKNRDEHHDMAARWIETVFSSREWCERVAMAVRQHRASNPPAEFHSPLAELIATADRGPAISFLARLPRAINYRTNILDPIQRFREAAKHIIRKYGTKGYITYPRMWGEMFNEDQYRRKIEYDAESFISHMDMLRVIINDHRERDDTIPGFSAPDKYSFVHYLIMANVLGKPGVDKLHDLDLYEPAHLLMLCFLMENHASPAVIEEYIHPTDFPGDCGFTSIVNLMRDWEELNPLVVERLAKRVDLLKSYGEEVPDVPELAGREV